MGLNNIDRTLEYLLQFAKADIQVDDRVIHQPINSIELSDTFFAIDSCVMCGYCCLYTHNVYTQSEYDKIMSYDLKNLEAYDPPLPARFIEDLRVDMIPSVHTINGKEVTLYTSAKEPINIFLPKRDRAKGKNVDRCHYMYVRPDGYRVCGVHPVRSITCRIPHMRVDRNRKLGKVYLSTRAYGRNWAIGCPVDFPLPKTVEEFEASKADKLEKMEYLLRVAKEYNIETWLPEVIDFIQHIPFENYQAYSHVNIIDKKTPKFFNLKG